MCDLELNLLFNLGRHTDSAQKCGSERYFQLGSQACRANAGISRIALGRADRSHRPDLPIIPGFGNGIKPRKIAALHRELSRHSKNKGETYFLSYRDAAKVCDGLS